MSFLIPLFRLKFRDVPVPTVREQVSFPPTEFISSVFTPFNDQSETCAREAELANHVEDDVTIHQSALTSIVDS